MQIYAPNFCAPATCEQICADFYQDFNLLCSEESTFKALRKGAKMAGWTEPPAMYAWRFDQIEHCPPGQPGRCAHGMEIAWLFGTISGRGIPPGLSPPNSHPIGLNNWNCSWDQSERAFSNNIKNMWTHFAASGNPGQGWPQHVNERIVSDNNNTVTRRINLAIGSTTILENFRTDKCAWWESAYERIRASQPQQPW